MTPRGWKIALAVSVALNVFALAAGSTLLIGRAKVEDRVERQRDSGRDRSVREIVAGMDPVVRDRIKPLLRESALAARPDFEDARAARREAIDLVRAQPVDEAAVNALLKRSREAELRGRARLEGDAVSLLATLDPADRQALAVILNRHKAGKGGGGRDGDRGDRRPEAPPAK